MIKVLKISAEGLPLYDGKCEINFINTQRTTLNDTEGMFKLSSSNANRLYTNNIESFFWNQCFRKDHNFKAYFFCFFCFKQRANK